MLDVVNIVFNVGNIWKTTKFKKFLTLMLYVWKLFSRKLEITGYDGTYISWWYLTNDYENENCTTEFHYSIILPK